jgi:hypothetical protein
MTDNIIHSILGLMRLQELEDKFQTYPPDRVEVIEPVRNRCYTFARTMAEMQDGYYIEGYTIFPTMSNWPVWHAFFMRQDGQVLESGVPVDIVRKGIPIPTSIFREYMRDAQFRRRFETYTEVPFHRACVETNKPMPWLRDVSMVSSSARRSSRIRSRR